MESDHLEDQSFAMFSSYSLVRPFGSRHILMELFALQGYVRDLNGAIGSICGLRVMLYHQFSQRGINFFSSFTRYSAIFHNIFHVALGDIEVYHNRIFSRHIAIL